MGVSGK